MQLQLWVSAPPMILPAVASPVRRPATGRMAGQGPALPERYYLQNFRGALDALRSRYGALLSDEEHQFIQRFAALSASAQCLLTRLLMRKGPLFRRATIRYAEVPDLAATLRELAALAWVDRDPVLTLEELHALLTRAEWRHIFRSDVRPRAAVDAAAQLPLPMAARAAGPRTLSQWHPHLDGAYIRVHVEAVARRLQWLYFGNGWQSWAEFVVVDLGLQRYEKVPFDESSLAFHSRAQIEHFYRLQECLARLQRGETAASLLPTMQTPDAVPDWLAARFASVQLQLGGMLQRQGETQLALDAYSQCGSAQGRIQLIRLHERLGQHAAAHAAAERALGLPGSEAEHQAITRAWARLRRRLDGVAMPRKAKPGLARMNVILPPLQDHQRVERQVCALLGTAEQPVFYVENSLWLSLFGLLCWESIFAPLPGAFFHPFQSGPADLFTPEFRARRAALIAAQLRLLETGEYEAVIRRHYRDKAGIISPFVRWGRLTPQILSLALQCIPALHLRVVFERLLDDLQNHGSGLPDLIQFHPREQRYGLLEVKAPGDRLQDNQLRWMEFFARHDIPAAVCNVQWTAPAAA